MVDGLSSALAKVWTKVRKTKIIIIPTPPSHFLIYSMSSSLNGISAASKYVTPRKTQPACFAENFKSFCSAWPPSWPASSNKQLLNALQQSVSVWTVNSDFVDVLLHQIVYYYSVLLWSSERVLKMIGPSLGCVCKLILGNHIMNHTCYLLYGCAMVDAKGLLPGHLHRYHSDGGPRYMKVQKTTLPDTVTNHPMEDRHGPW